ncbi:MAG TPA: 2-dehydropantoate 2-reductase [Bordetella sp.]
MKICIYGLGAIGGLLGARLAAAGEDVSAVTRRGATLTAVQQRGLTLIETEESGSHVRHIPIHAVEDPAELGPQDLVIVAVKTTSLADAAQRIGPLLGPGTTVLSAMNGVPWWFFHGLGPEFAGTPLPSVDRDGRLAAAIPMARIVGCVVHLSSATPAPGVVQHVIGNRLIIGEPTGGADTPRAQAVIAALRRAGFDVEASRQIQHDIWFKLLGNMTVNPVSAMTGATGDRILADDLVRGFMSRCMLEAAAVGERIGIPVVGTPEDRHAVTRKMGAFRTSMLQDVEAGRKVELDALVGTVRDIAQSVKVDTPNIDALFGLARLHALVQGLYD